MVRNVIGGWSNRMKQRANKPKEWSRPELKRLGAIKDVRGISKGLNEMTGNAVHT